MTAVRARKKSLRILPKVSYKMPALQVSKSSCFGQDDTEQKGQPADFLSRAAAMMIDCVFLIILMIGCSLIFAQLVYLFPPANFENIFRLFGVTLLLFLAGPFILTLVYFVVLHSFGGQTLGKIFMGICVVSEKGQGLSVGGSFLRLVGYLVSFIPFGAGFLWVVLDKNHSSWHDKLSFSRVIFCQ